MWKIQQSLRNLIESSDDTTNRKKRTTTTTTTENDRENNDTTDEHRQLVDGKYDHNDEIVFGSRSDEQQSTRPTDEVTWYDNYKKLYARTTKARWILGVGLIVVNILVVTYILLMYAFVSTVNTGIPEHGRGKGESIWRTAGIVTILNSVPVIVAFNVLSSNNNHQNIVDK